VPVQVFRPKPKRPVAFRDGVLGVVAQDQEAGRGVPVDAPIGLGARVFLVKSVQTTLRATRGWLSLIARKARFGQEKSLKAA
jgi:hypothetical protein